MVVFPVMASARFFILWSSSMPRPGRRPKHPWATPGPSRHTLSSPRSAAVVAKEFCGLPHTFDNKRAGSRNVRVRLDRAVADDNWHDIFSAASVNHLVSPASDHCPVPYPWKGRYVISLGANGSEMTFFLAIGCGATYLKKIASIRRRRAPK
jgi:hypothetical protein